MDLADKLVDTGFAHEARPAVDLGAARTALGGLAVPAAGEVIGKIRLHVVDRVEHHHAFDGGDFKSLLRSGVGVAAEDLKDDRAGCRAIYWRFGAHVRTCWGFGGLAAGGCGAGGAAVSVSSLASS